jgi:hypothetical protein
MALSSRGRALRWLTQHRGCTEQPPGSNRDTRRDGITAAQLRCANGGRWLIGQPWCGVWAFNALRAAGVHGITSRMASVTLIEQDATARRRPFREWIPKPARTGRHWRRINRGDLVVMFGPGVHVETLRSTAWIYRRLGLVVTDGGNTSSGDAGSQANGGGSYRRLRRIQDIWGIATVDYPGK